MKSCPQPADIEGQRVHRAVEHHRTAHAVRVQRRDQGRGHPVSVRHGVDAPLSAEIRRVSGNLERITTQDAAKLNTLDLAQYKKIIVSTKALEAIIARVTGGKN